MALLFDEREAQTLRGPHEENKFGYSAFRYDVLRRHVRIG